MDHAQFEKVSTHLEVGMRLLFDPAMPYFGAWLELYDFDQRWDVFSVRNKHRGSPLYDASLCGFRDLAARLVAKHPRHVSATLGQCLSPLAAALREGLFEIAELLCQNGADVGIRGYETRTLLHAASAGGFVDIAQWLLDRCIDVHSRQDNHEAPLHLEEASEHPGHRKGVDVADDSNRTPLHLASLGGHFQAVRLPLDHGAEVTSLDRKHKTPLHLASSKGSAKTVRVLIEPGADVSAKDESHGTPLHEASTSESAETVRLLIKQGVDVNARDGSNTTPLHLASSKVSAETV